MANTSVGMFKCYGNKEGLQSNIADNSLQPRKESWKLKDGMIKVILEKEAFDNSMQDNCTQGCSWNHGGQGGSCNNNNNPLYRDGGIVMARDRNVEEGLGMKDILKEKSL